MNAETSVENRIFLVLCSVADEEGGWETRGEVWCPQDCEPCWDILSHTVSCDSAKVECVL